MDKKQLVFTLCLVGYLLVSTFAYVYALPPDPPIYWTDYFDKADVYQSTKIFNANWTYTATPNFTVSVSNGILTIKFSSGVNNTGQYFHVWRGCSKNENGIHLRFKVATTGADPFQFGLSDTGTDSGSGLKYFVEFSWKDNNYAIFVRYTAADGTLKESPVLTNYTLSNWYWVDLTYTTPAQFIAKVWADSNPQKTYNYTTSDVKYTAAELWATAIRIWGSTTNTPKTVYFYVDYAEFNAPSGYFGGSNLDYVYPLIALIFVVGMIGAALKFIKW